MRVKMALPKGQLQNTTAELLKEAGFAVGDYREGSRSYRPRCESNSELFLKVFHEKDIAIQVAIGNYDLGICRLEWVEELLAKYHSDAVAKVPRPGLREAENLRCCFQVFRGPFPGSAEKTFRKPAHC